MASKDDRGIVNDERYVYDAYGNGGTAAGGFPFRYTGQKLDPGPSATPMDGLCHCRGLLRLQSIHRIDCSAYGRPPQKYKARYYDPQVGRFLQTDPIGYQDQMNLYAYVANDPVNNIDPSGMEGYSCIMGTACQVKSDADFNASIPENVRQFEEQIIADKYGGRTLADLEADPTYHAYSNIGVLCTDCTVADVIDDYGRQPAPTWDGSIKESPVQSGDITRCSVPGSDGLDY